MDIKKDVIIFEKEKGASLKLSLSPLPSVLLTCQSVKHIFDHRVIFREIIL